MNYVLFLTSIIITVLSSVFTKIFMNKNSEGVSVFSFNTVSCFVWLVVLIPSIVISGEPLFSLSSLICGVIYGILLFLLLWCNYCSVEEGPFSITKFVTCPAFIVPTLYAVFFLGEGLTAKQIFGIILILVALGLCANPRYSKEPLTRKWYLYAFGLFLANGLIGIFYKVTGKILDKSEYDAMLCVAAITAIIQFLGIFLAEKIRFKKISAFPQGKKLILVFAAGLCTCSFIKLNLYVSNLLPAAVIFPVSNCGIVILSTLAGFMLFKEKLSKMQIWGIIIGIASILAYS